MLYQNDELGISNNIYSKTAFETKSVNVCVHTHTFIYTHSHKRLKYLNIIS